MDSLDLLLAGREGNGKSSTGNSILNQKAFNPSSAFSQASTEILARSGIIDGRTVQVVDGLSLHESSIDGKNNAFITIDLAEKLVSMFANGFTALGIVLKYGARFTQQEKTAIHIIRSLFGDSVLKNYGVVIITYGDSFEKDLEEEQTTFESWCQQQIGEIRDIFRECGYRYVLFNNRTKDSVKMKEQVRNLMSKVAEVQSKSTRYTIDTFRYANFSRKKLLVESKLPELQSETSSFLDGIIQNVRKLDDSFLKPINCIQELATLKKKVDAFISYLEREDEGTNSIGQLKLQISVTEASINAKRERNERKMEYDAMIPRSNTPPLAGQHRAFPYQTTIGIILAMIFFLLIIFWGLNYII